MTFEDRNGRLMVLELVQSVFQSVFDVAHGWLSGF